MACKSYYFGWEGWDGTLCVPNAFSFFFLQKKSITFKKNYIALLHLKRNNLNCLNWHRYFVVYRLYCLNTSDRLAGAPLLCCRVALWPPLFLLSYSRWLLLYLCLFFWGLKQNCFRRIELLFRSRDLIAWQIIFWLSYSNLFKWCFWHFPSSSHGQYKFEPMARVVA